MTDGSRETRRTLGEARCFFSIFSMEPARRASSGSHVSPEVAGVRRKPPRHQFVVIVFFRFATPLKTAAQPANSQLKKRSAQRSPR